MIICTINTFIEAHTKMTKPHVAIIADRLGGGKTASQPTKTFVSFFYLNFYEVWKINRLTANYILLRMRLAMPAAMR